MGGLAVHLFLPTATRAGEAGGAGGLDAAALRELVTSTLLDFNVAIKAKDFSAFHYHLAAAFQRQRSREELLARFAPFIDNHADLGGVRDLVPTFDDAPAVGADGVLALAGRFETRPFRVLFDLKYANEAQPQAGPAGAVPPRWRLLGIKVTLAPADDAPASPAGGR